MKHMTLTLLLFAGLFSLKAPASILHLDIVGYGNYTMRIDGRSWNGSDNYTVNHLRPGLHRIVVSKWVNDGYGYCGTRRVVLFDGEIDIAPKMEVFARLGRHGHLQITSERPLFRCDHGCRSHGSCTHPGGAKYRPHRPVHHPHRHHNPGYGRTKQHFGVAPHRFNNFIASLERESFESTKMNMATNFVRYNGLNAQQLKIMMSVMTFESDRVRLAKAAFPRMVDRENFFIVFDELTFSSSKDELIRFARRG